MSPDGAAAPAVEGQGPAAREAAPGADDDGEVVDADDLLVVVEEAEELEASAEVPRPVPPARSAPVTPPLPFVAHRPSRVTAAVTSLLEGGDLTTIIAAEEAAEPDDAAPPLAAPPPQVPHRAGASSSARTRGGPSGPSPAGQGFDEVLSQVVAEPGPPAASAESLEIEQAPPLLSGAGGFEAALRRLAAEADDPTLRLQVYEGELRFEQSRARVALLEHEVGSILERAGARLATPEDLSGEGAAIRAYARSMAADPLLRPNLWAVRRVFYRRKLWSSLLKLLEAEIRYASSDQERAELLVERGVLYEDCLGDVDEAMRCYQEAHRFDPTALGPLGALEKALPVADADAQLDVERALARATQEPGRRVALLIHLARSEVERAPSEDAAGAVERALAYLHEAYECGADQLRVVDEIIRLTESSGRVEECLAALDVKVELMDLSAAGGRGGSPLRAAYLIDEVVSIRRHQAQLARERLKNPELVWYYLQAANSRSPADPLLVDDMLLLAEDLGRYDDLDGLLQVLGERLEWTPSGERRPLPSLLLRRAEALFQRGLERDAAILESEIEGLYPGSLPLLVQEERRGLRRRHLQGLGGLYRREAELALAGVALREGEAAVPDPLWATAAELRAASCLSRIGEFEAAEELLRHGEARLLQAPESAQRAALLRQCGDRLELLLEMQGRWGPLGALYLTQLARHPNEAGSEQERLHEAGLSLFGQILGDDPGALSHVRALCALRPEERRLWSWRAELARRAGEGREELLALEVLDRLDPGAPGSPASGDALWGAGARLLRRAELCAQLGNDERALQLYTQWLEHHPGDQQALGALEALLRRGGRTAELQALLRSQLDRCAASMAGHADEAAGRRLLDLQLRLAELLERDLDNPEEAAAIYRVVLMRQPGSATVLRALTQLYRRLHDLPRLAAALELLSRALPAGEARAAVLLELGDVYERALERPPVGTGALSHSPPRAEDVASAYESATQEALAALRSQGGEAQVLRSIATHASLGLCRAAARLGFGSAFHGRAARLLGVVLDELDQSGVLPPVEAALLREEQAFLQQAGSGLPARARADIRAPEGASGFAQAVLGLLRARRAMQQHDSKLLGNALDELAQAGGTSAVTAELSLRAGMLGLLNEESARDRLDQRTRLLRAAGHPDVAALASFLLADGLEGAPLLEEEARSPERVAGLRAALAQVPLLEAEVLLGAAAAQGSAELRHQAMRAATAALEASPDDPAPLLLLRHGYQQELSDPLAPKELVAAAAQWALRLAGLLRAPQPRSRLYVEAADLLARLGDRAGTAAALRAALEETPWDAVIFGRAYEAMVSYAQGAEADGAADAGPLLELLNFRLSLAAQGEAEQPAERALRVALLLQRAALLQAAGDEDATVADLEALLQLDPAHLVARRRLGGLLIGRDDPQRQEEAILHMERYLEGPLDSRERRAVHLEIAAVLADRAPERATPHVQSALALFPQVYPEGLQADDEEAVQMEGALHRWLVRLHAARGDYTEAVAALERFAALLPPGPSHGIEQARIELEVADILQTEAHDARGALRALERALAADPTSLEALDRLVPLCQELGEGALQEQHLRRAVQEARRQAAAQREEEVNGEPYHALAQLFGWLKQDDAGHLARQAAALMSGRQPPPERPLQELRRALGAPLATAAFDVSARGTLLDLWREVADTANRLLGPDLAALQANPKERLNGRDLPPVWQTVDNLVQRLSDGARPAVYGLYMSRDQELCQLSGSNLVCGSAYASTLTQLSPRQYFRLVRTAVLLPDRLGPLLSTSSDELLLFLAALGQVAELPAPPLPQALAGRLGEWSRSLGRMLQRKERRALQPLGERLRELYSGEPPQVRERVLGWLQAVRWGAARLALALAGDLPAALEEVGVASRELRPRAVALTPPGRALVLFSVSTEIDELRRSLGLGVAPEQERHRGLR